jgi:NSS family neurotransmitter:Na+ symporter
MQYTGRMNQHGGTREFWSSRAGFILATVGSAIGLGSIWKFPYEVGTNGGGAFVLFYLIGLVVIVLPLMLLEFAVGRRGGADAIGSIARVAEQSGASGSWKLIGAVGIAAAFLILSFYSVIGGWALAYIVETGRGGLAGDTASTVQGRFDALMASPQRMIVYHTIFMGMSAVIVARGIARGIEEACKIMMPVLIFLLIVLAAYAAAEGDVAAALRFLFVVDMEHVTATVALEALGLGFFSIGVGLAVMITYAAYAGRDIDLREIAVATLLGDTAVSFVASLAVFPLVFAEKLDPASGPGLIFVTLSLAFARLPLGTMAAAAFFVLLALAALASAISLLEMPVAFLVRKAAWTRPPAAALSAGACWAVGLVSVLSFNRWSGWFPLASVPAFAKATPFELLDQLTSNALLPAGGTALAIFGGWVVPRRILAEELRLGPVATGLLRALLRYVVPCGIAATALASLRLW